jgi:hypothetical protein
MEKTTMGHIILSNPTVLMNNPPDALMYLSVPDAGCSTVLNHISRIEYRIEFF